MTATTDPIRSAVREYYGARARDAGSCCSGDRCGNDLYRPDLLADLPPEAAGFSLGCGDPVSLAGLRPGETVLDLGSGGGLDCFLAARAVGEAGRAIGVDMTPEMIERARGAARRLGAANVEFRQGFLEDLPLDDASVDVILSNCVINLSPDKPQVFREMFRVLKPGGRVAVSDIVANGLLNPLIARGVEAWAGCIAGALDVKDYRDGLAEAGFEAVRITPREGGINGLLAHVPVGAPYSAAVTARKPEASR